MIDREFSTFEINAGRVVAVVFASSSPPKREDDVGNCPSSEFFLPRDSNGGTVLSRSPRRIRRPHTAAGEWAGPVFASASTPSNSGEQNEFAKEILAPVNEEESAINQLVNRCKNRRTEDIFGIALTHRVSVKIFKQLNDTFDHRRVLSVRPIRVHK